MTFCLVLRLSLIVDFGLKTGFPFFFSQMGTLSGAFQEGLMQAMRQYGSVSSIKTRMDILQMDYACCGDHSYKDWFTIAWVSDDVLVANAKEVQA